MQFQNFQVLCCLPHHHPHTIPPLPSAWEMAVLVTFSTITVGRMWAQSSHSMYSSDRLDRQLWSDFSNNSDSYLLLNTIFHFSTVFDVSCFLLLHWYTFKGTKYFVLVALKYNFSIGDWPYHIIDFALHPVSPTPLFRSHAYMDQNAHLFFLATVP